MPDQGFQALEESLGLCDDMLERAGVDIVASADPDALHGCVILERFDPAHSVCRPYRRRESASLFRTLVRSYSHNEVKLKEIEDSLNAYLALGPYFQQYLNIDLPTMHTDMRVFFRDLLVKDVTAWPDDVYYGLQIEFENMNHAVRALRPEFLDLYAEWHDKLSPSDALKQVVDVFCQGPWAGVPIPTITDAMRTLQVDLASGKNLVDPPLATCLKPGSASRLMLPLWKDGFQGILTILIGGTTDRLTVTPDVLISQYQKLADVIASCLARKRLRHASQMISSGARGEGYSDLGGLPDAMQHILSPHHLTRLSINGRFWRREGPAASDDQIGPPQSFAVSIAGMDVEGDFQLCMRTNLFDDDIEPLSVMARIEDLVFQHALLQSDYSGHANQVDRDHSPLQSAKVVLERNRDQNLTTKDYFTCFVALAVLEKGKAKNFQVTGSYIRSLQKRLYTDYSIRRRTANNETNGSGEPAQLAISQMVVGSESLREAEATIGGIRLDKGRGSLLVALTR